MAKVTHDVYNILDENGNVVGQQIYPQGGSLYSGAQSDRAAGRNPEVYYSAPEQQYVPVREAKAQITFSPETNKITIKGPKWLTGEIKNSDWFKKQYSQNSVVSQLMRTVKDNPDATVADPTDDNKQIKAIDMLKKIEGYANSYAENYSGIVDYSDRMNDIFGVKMDPSKVAISQTFYNKKDYDKKGAIYVPERARGLFNWEGLDSWDADHGTVTAEDFFENVYKLSGDNKAAVKLREEMKKFLQGAADYKSYDSGLEEDRIAKEENLSDESYAEEIARAWSFYNILSKNKPEVENWFDAAMWGAGAGTGFAKAAENGGANVSSAILDVFEWVSNSVEAGISDIGLGESPIGKAAVGAVDFWRVTNPAYFGAATIGEFVQALDSGSKTGDVLGEFINGFKEDIDVYLSGDFGPEVKQARDTIDALFAEFDSNMSGLTDAWTIGEGFGNLAWKVWSNMVILNPLGGKVEAAIEGGRAAGGALRSVSQISAWISRSSAINYLGKFATPNTIGMILKVLGKTANVATQGIVETLMDNKQVVDKAFEYGLNTKEGAVAMTEIIKNTYYNAIGEAVGFGQSKGAALFVTKTPVGKAAATGLTKVTNKVAGWKNTQLHKLFSMLNKGKEGSLAEWMTQFYKVEAESNELIASIPVFGEMSEDLANAISRGLSLQSGEVAESAIEGASKEGAEAVSEGVGKKTLKERIEENFSAQQDAIQMRLNAENNLDAIYNGIQTKMNDVNAYAMKEQIATSESAAKLAKLERDAAKNGADLTFRKTGSILSKESSEYISFRSQQVHYQNEVNYLKGLSERTAAQTKAMNTKEAFLEKIGGKLDSLRKSLGPDATDAAEELLVDLAAYYKKAQQFFIDKGYFTEEHATKISGWYNDKVSGWEENGVNKYIPTQRLFENQDYEASMKSFATKLDETKSYSVSAVADDPYSLKLGDADNSFLDPIAVASGNLFRYAQSAQAQDWGRALAGISIANRAIKGVDSKGFSIRDINLVQKGIKGLDKDFTAMFSVKGGDRFGNIVRDAFDKSDVFTEVRARSKGKEKKISELKKERAVSRKNEEQILSLNKITVQRSTVHSLSAADTANLIDAVPMPEGVSVPVYNIKALRAADFDEWFEGLPKASKDFLDSKFKAAGYNRNVTNLKKLLKSDSDLNLQLTKTWMFSKDENAINFRKADQFKSFVRDARTKQLEADQLTTLREYQQETTRIEKEISKIKHTSVNEFDVEGGKGANYAASIATMREDIVDKVMVEMRKNELYADVIDRMVKASNGLMSEDEAARYLVLRHLNKMTDKSSAPFKRPLTATKGGSLSSSSAAKAAKKAKVVQTQTTDHYIQNIADALQSDVKTTFNKMQQDLIETRGLSDVVDVDTYFEEIQKNIADIEGRAMTTVKGGKIVDLNRKVVQIVDSEGELRFVEVNPLYANIAHNLPGRGFPVRNAVMQGLSNASSTVNAVFRFGTTGIDKTSYTNQWIRDPLNAGVIGGAMPFTDLQVSGIKNKFKAFVHDYVPFGRKIWGGEVTATISKSVVDSTADATIKGLQEEFGEAWWNEFAEDVTRSMPGASKEAIKEAIDRAAVEYRVNTIGFSNLPTQSTSTEAEYFRISASGKEEMVKPSDVRREGLRAAFGDLDPKGVQKVVKTMHDTFNGALVDASKGQWREHFMRDAVFTSNYRAAIESGKTSSEATAWAQRYAMDATTNFSRPFAYGNELIRNIPYLGAAINGQKSFFRLLELDPAGVAARFATGIIMPYTAILTDSLSDPTNREVYKTFKEYEKEDALCFVYRGVKISVPMPQEFSALIAPFRQVVEGAAGVQDLQWWDLAASDALGLLPLDLSGFVNLDANTLMAQGEDGLWSRIGRGVEKAASSLMPPYVKAVWMGISGHDPYTGREIDTSYQYEDEYGNIITMDSTTSDVAEGLRKVFPKLSASAAYQVMRNLIGRSSVNFLESVIDIFNGTYKPEDALFSAVEEHTKPFSGGSDYDQARSDWNAAIDKAYEMKRALLSDEKLQQAKRALRTATNEEEKKNLLRSYNEATEQYYSYLLNMASEMRRKYPTQYTQSRVAQIVSLMNFYEDASYLDTEYSRQVQQDAFYNAKTQSINTLIRLGFPTDTTENMILGHGYYGSDGGYRFDFYTPYEIQYITDATFGTGKRIEAIIEQELDSADITTQDKWNGYNAVKNNKAAKKQYKRDWNKKVVKALAPTVQKYGVDAVADNSRTRDILNKYLFIDNQYKVKEYLKEIFGE